MVPKRVVLPLILAVLKWIRLFDLVNTCYPMGLSTGSEAFFYFYILTKTPFFAQSFSTKRLESVAARHF